MPPINFDECPEGFTASLKWLDEQLNGKREPVPFLPWEITKWFVLWITLWPFYACWGWILKRSEKQLFNATMCILAIAEGIFFYWLIYL